MPLYARGGGIIAIAPVQQFVSERAIDSLKMRIWHGSGEWTLYEDDGHSFEHEKGVWSTTNYQVYLAGEKIIVEVAVREGEFAIGDREITVEVVGIGEQRFTDDGTVRCLTFSARFSTISVGTQHCCVLLSMVDFEMERAIVSLDRTQPVIPLWLDKIHFKNSPDVSRLAQSQKTSNKFGKGVG